MYYIMCSPDLILIKLIKNEFLILELGGLVDLVFCFPPSPKYDWVELASVHVQFFQPGKDSYRWPWILYPVLPFTRFAEICAHFIH